MKLVPCVLAALMLFSLDIEAECWVTGHDYDGREIIECDRRTEPLPVCGSEFDRGGRCVTKRRQPQSRQREYGDPLDYSSTGRTPFNAAGQTPFNAGASWPSRAEAMRQGRR